MSIDDPKFQKVVPITARVIYSWDKRIFSLLNVQSLDISFNKLYQICTTNDNSKMFTVTGFNCVYMLLSQLNFVYLIRMG